MSSDDYDRRYCRRKRFGLDGAGRQDPISPFSLFSRSGPRTVYNDPADSGHEERGAAPQAVPKHTCTKKGDWRIQHEESLKAKYGDQYLSRSARKNRNRHKAGVASQELQVMKTQLEQIQKHLMGTVPARPSRGRLPEGLPQGERLPEGHPQQLESVPGHPGERLPEGLPQQLKTMPGHQGERLPEGPPQG